MSTASKHHTKKLSNSARVKRNNKSKFNQARVWADERRRELIANEKK